MLLTLAWTVFSLFLAATIWKTAKKHSQPQLGYSTWDNHREAFFARFVRKMSMTSVALCVASAVVVWSSFTLALLLLLAIPAVAALQIVRSKRAIESSKNRSLPIR